MNSPSMLKLINDHAVFKQFRAAREAREMKTTSFGRNFDLPVGLNGRVVPKKQRMAAGFVR